MSLSLIILFIVLAGIALRKLNPMHTPIWIIMLLGALAVLITKQISVTAASHAIDYNIIGYLFGVFIIGQALEESGYLGRLSYHVLRFAKDGRQLILVVFVLAGLSSALLMNDTIAIMATPVLLHIGRHNKMDHKPLLLALAYAVTIGSVMSPIGNPQNLLIAVKSGMPTPFVSFFGHLFIPTLLCLAVAYMVIVLRYGNRFDHEPIQVTPERPHNPMLTLITKISFTLFLFLILLKIISAFWKTIPDLPFSLIAILSALPILLFSRQRFKVLQSMDWSTLVFFAAMFVLMQSVWDAGTFQSLIKDTSIDIHSTPSILGIGVVVSQLISNVPLVALYLPLLMNHSAQTVQLLALAAGSTIAGNFFIMGAASNVIVIQSAEKRRRHGFSFMEFAITGVPIGCINIFIYWLFLR